MHITFLLDYALVGEELEVVEAPSIEVVDGVITSIGRASAGGRNPVRVSGVALPALVNGHLHVLDYAFPEFGDEAPYTISQLVREPDGLKYRLVSALSPLEARSVARAAFSRMLRYGVGVALTYVERPLFDAVRGGAEPGMDVVILGGLLGGEVATRGEEVVRGADGVGLDSPLRFSVEELKEIRALCRGAGKLISTHIAETRSIYERGDFRLAMEYLDPDLIVHGTHLSDEDLEVLAERGVSVAACPRSNTWFGVGLPPLAKMLDRGLNVVLGTDNAGVIEFDVWRELEEAYRLLRLQGGPRVEYAKEVLKMATVNVSRVRGLRGRVRNVIEEGARASFIVLALEGLCHAKPRNLHASIVKRGSGSAVTHIVLGERVTKLGVR